MGNVYGDPLSYTNTYIFPRNIDIFKNVIDIFKNVNYIFKNVIYIFKNVDYIFKNANIFKNVICIFKNVIDIFKNVVQNANILISSTLYPRGVKDVKYSITIDNLKFSMDQFVLKKARNRKMTC